MFHTAYTSYESKLNGRDYIGKHSTEYPYDDYKGSFKDEEFDPDSKIVMAYAKTAQGALWFEINFHNVFDVARDPQYVNRSKQTSTGFDVTGVSFSCTEETRQLLSELNMGERNPMYGRTGEKSPRYGKCHTEEAKKKMSEGHTGKTLTDETKQLIREATKGEKNPNFGLTGERNWYVNPTGETRWCKEPPGPEWQLGRKWKG